MRPFHEIARSVFRRVLSEEGKSALGLAVAPPCIPLPAKFQIEGVYCSVVFPDRTLLLETDTQLKGATVCFRCSIPKSEKLEKFWVQSIAVKYRDATQDELELDPDELCAFVDHLTDVHLNLNLNF